jgi:hypothetical protein
LTFSLQIIREFGKFENSKLMMSSTCHNINKKASNSSIILYPSAAILLSRRRLGNGVVPSPIAARVRCKPVFFPGAQRLHEFCLFIDFISKRCVARYQSSEVENERKVLLSSLEGIEEFSRDASHG